MVEKQKDKKVKKKTEKIYDEKIGLGFAAIILLFFGILKMDTLYMEVSSAVF